MHFKDNSLKICTRAGDIMNKQIADYIRRAEKLWDMAEQDELYGIWKAEYEDRKRRLSKIERFLPKKFAWLIRDYMDYEARRLNRVISLACMCMEFTGQKPFEFRKRRKRNIIAFVPERDK